MAAVTTDDIVARNLDVVQQHLHNETPELIDVAMGLYPDSITWEIPARGLCLRTHAQVRPAYVDLFTAAHRAGYHWPTGCSGDAVCNGVWSPA